MSNKKRRVKKHAPHRDDYEDLAAIARARLQADQARWARGGSTTAASANATPPVKDKDASA